MVTLARAADAAYDAEIKENGTWTCEAALRLHLNQCNEPVSLSDFQSLLVSIAHQIEEEGVVSEAHVPDVALFPSWVNSPAGIYRSAQDYIGINLRYIFDRGWRNNDFGWLDVLVHEMIHAQGVWVGPSEVLEAQTETLTYEVMAGLANRNYPGARADLLRSLRSDALWAAWWFAQGRPVLHQIKNNGYYICSIGSAICSPTADEGKMARWTALRAELLTPFELRQAAKSARWWWSRPDKAFEAVLWKYVMPVLIPLVENACGDGVLDEGYEIVVRRLMTPEDYRLFLLPATNSAVRSLAPLAVDDLAYVLRNELGAC